MNISLGANELKLLVTGCSGFIGYHISKRLCISGHEVIGIDNMNPYYDVRLKEARLNKLLDFENFAFELIDISSEDCVKNLFSKHSFQRVIHMAAQAGVRYSIENPDAYITSNLIGHFNILESCRMYNIEHLLFASSSSVYGLNKKLPFSTNDSSDHPVSLYAATKKSNELMSHSYSSLYGLPITGLRFFTVYGPWGRPDMALFKFTESILSEKKIDIYNHGELARDFTYIDDISSAIEALIDIIPLANESWNTIEGPISESSAPYKIYNIGNSKPIDLIDFISALEAELGIKAKKNFLPMQRGDVLRTHADVNDLSAIIDYQPKDNLKENIGLFVQWYKKYYMSL